jgi:uncharacterized protein
MTLFNYIRLFAFCLLAAWATASGEAQQLKAQSQSVGARTDSQLATRQLIRDSLPKPHGFVNDYENIYTDRDEAVLDSLIRAFEKKTTIQIVVITFDTTMTTRDSLDALTLYIGNAWGVGQKGKNNGVAIGISRGYRRITIRNGYGIEMILTNEETKQIIDTAFIPDFRESRYFEGTSKGLLELMSILEQRNE